MAGVIHAEKEWSWVGNVKHRGIISQYAEVWNCGMADTKREEPFRWGRLIVGPKKKQEDGVSEVPS